VVAIEEYKDHEQMKQEELKVHWKYMSWELSKGALTKTLNKHSKFFKLKLQRKWIPIIEKVRNPRTNGTITKKRDLLKTMIPRTMVKAQVKRVQMVTRRNSIRKMFNAI
jgi:hypothetical protein